MIKIDIKNLYAGNKLVLEQAHAQIERGQFVVISGASGSGKSTLLNAMCNLTQSYEGKIELLGIENKTVSTSEMRVLFRDFLSIITQDNGLVLNETVLANIKYIPRVRKNFDSDELINALDLVNLNKTVLKQKVANLSGGEQQRVALAKAILKRSKIIISDEPTGNLDAQNASKVYEVFKQLTKAGVTVCIVSHDPNAYKYADKVYVIQNRKLYFRK